MPVYLYFWHYCRTFFFWFRFTFHAFVNTKRNCRHEILIDFFPLRFHGMLLCFLGFHVSHLNTNGFAYFWQYFFLTLFSLLWVLFLFLFSILLMKYLFFENANWEISIWFFFSSFLLLAECEEQSAVVCTCEWKGVIGMNGMYFNAVQFALCIGPHHESAREIKCQEWEKALYCFWRLDNCLLELKEPTTAKRNTIIKQKYFVVNFSPVRAYS